MSSLGFGRQLVWNYRFTLLSQSSPLSERTGKFRLQNRFLCKFIFEINDNWIIVLGQSTIIDVDATIPVLVNSPPQRLLHWGPIGIEERAFVRGVGAGDWRFVLRRSRLPVPIHRRAVPGGVGHFGSWWRTLTKSTRYLPFTFGDACEWETRFHSHLLLLEARSYIHTGEQRA